jgi:hypothetical protein
MLGNGLGPWRLRFIYNLNMQLLNKNHIYVSALSSKMNKRLHCTSTLNDAVQTKGQGRMEVPCVNGDADKIYRANYETV